MKRLIAILKKADPKTIVVVGDVMLDEYLVGEVERISPEAPVPVLKEGSVQVSFGGAANVAINCKRVGCEVFLIGLIGDRDATGEKLLSMLVDKNVMIEGLIKTPDRVTTRKTRIVARQQQLLRIDSEQTHPLSTAEKDHLICNIHTIIKPGSLVLISDYAKGVVDYHIVEEVVARAKVCDAIVVADPKGPRFDKYKGVHYLKPNMKEFNQMVDFFGLSKEGSIVDNGRKIIEGLGLKRGLIVTMGDEGLMYISRDQELFFPAEKREVFDITGAGDTVLSFLAVGLVNGFAIDESLWLANAAAAVAVSHHKTYAVSLEELLDTRFIGEEKIYSDWTSLREQLDWLRGERGKRVVLTNGCFDLIHFGHIHVLQEAKKRGDILVVALNTDESVKRYKGEGRPIKTLEERAKIMASIGVVDYVVFFDQDTPAKLITFLSPDVLIKGGDYEIEKIVGYDFVTSYGGKVETIDYQKGFSTTNLVEKVKETLI